MVKRKVLTTLLATPLSLLFIFAIFFGEWKQPLELLVMTGMFSFFASPYFIFYGAPVTFLSDYVSKKLTGILRIITALFIHVMFGAMFGLFFPSGVSLSIFGSNVDSYIVFGSFAALIFCITDEILRLVLPKNSAVNDEKSYSARFKYWFISFIILFIISLLALTTKNIIDDHRMVNTMTSINWDAVIIANILYSSGLALLLSPLGYMAIKTNCCRKTLNKLFNT